MKYVISIVFLSAFLSLHASEAFKVNKVERALINPKGTLEATGLLYSTLGSNKKNENDSYVNMRYSLSKKLEFVLLGANYLVYNNASSDYIIGIRNVGASSNSTDGTSLGFEFKFKGKNRFSDNKYALEYHALYTYFYNSSYRDGYMAEFLIEPIMAINNYVSLSLSARFIDGDNTYPITILNKHAITGYYDIGCNVYININKYVELYVKYTHFDNTNPSFPSFNLYGYDFFNLTGNRIGFGGSFRFFF